MARGIIRGVISVAGSKIGAILITLIVTPIIVNQLGSANYGDYAVVTSIIGIAFIFVDAGIFDGLRKFIAEDPESVTWRSEVFGLYLWYGVSIALVVSMLIAILAVSSVPSRIYGAKFRTYFLLGSIMIFGKQFFSIFRSSLHGLSLEHRADPLRVLSQFIFGILAIAAVYQGLGVSSLLTARLVALAVVIALSFYFLQTHIDFSNIFRPRNSNLSWSRITSFNIQSMILAVLMESMYHADILLLQPFQGSSVAGFYKGALVVSEFLWFVPTAIQTVFLQTSSHLWTEAKTEQITRISSRSTRYTSLALFLLVIGLAALAEPFLTTYYNPDFQASVVPLLILLPGTFAFALARPIFAIGQGKGDLRILIVASGTSALINLGLNVVLIPRFGMVGAAFATSIGYGSMLLFHIIAARKIGFNPLTDLRIVRVLVTALGAAIPIFGLATYIQSDLLSLLVVPPVGFVIYILLAFVTGAVTLSELREIVASFQNG